MLITAGLAASLHENKNDGLPKPMATLPGLLRIHGDEYIDKRFEPDIPEQFTGKYPSIFGCSQSVCGPPADLPVSENVCHGRESRTRLCPVNACLV
ncbi:hypothetical protein HPB48_021606 [Haemaphysalis longicornis]|uniref:Uncharacterized protein n=1 Tax=Haemaphysalis longicornis TaxID=44386 RepID=A0A9J6G8Q3_HAELO|nr:hypothetical protein HPB48_021606 [Haemaphysalis longicornis]